MTHKNINETAGGGAVGAGGIAVRTDGPGIKGPQRLRLQTYLRKIDKKVKNRFNYKPVTPFPIKINEAFDMQDVLSRLRGIEGKSLDVNDYATYGVEDDDGNIMKISVRKDQGPEFEATLAHELADIENGSITGSEGKDISMAELLYNLKDKFDIVDVEFPKIPTDVVYNADQATYQANDTALPANDMVDDSQADGGGDPFADDGMGGAPAGGPGADGEDDEFAPVGNRNDPLDLNDVDGGEDLDSPGAGLAANGEGDEMGDMPPEGDAEGVEDFMEPEADQGSILDKVLDMLKAQAEAATAQANAAAEKSRADQAEYSVRAANATIAQEEELARMEAQVTKQKDEEKQAKRLADIAKFRVSQSSNLAGGGLTEADANETPAMIRRLISQLPQKWAVSPQDDPETRTYKNMQRTNEMRELQTRMRSAQLRLRRAQEMGQRGMNDDPTLQQGQQQGQQQQGQQQAGANGNANM